MLKQFKNAKSKFIHTDSYALNRYDKEACKVAKTTF